MAQRDVVLRWIEQLGRLVARLLGRASAGDLATARQQVDDAVGTLLGPLSTVLPHLEAGSAADLLQDPERIFAYARLIDLEAAILQASGDLPGADDRRSRAAALAREAVARETEERPDWDEWIATRLEPARPGETDAADR